MTRPGGPPDLTDGRDELNLAEFPLTLLTDRVPDGLESLSFSDTVYDSGDGGRPVVRTLTITPAAGLGLPTAGDGDVLLGLIQLTRWANGFADRSVSFSRYELVSLLRWPDTGYYYERVEQSLNRWMGVTLFFDRAWWDRRQRSWVNEKFHVLDRVSLRRRAEGRSVVTWGEVVFNSFRAENVKKLDLQVYFDLRLAPARRLYRFLDKRFHQRRVVSFDLRTLACEHVGLARAATDAELRRRLAPAVAELEDCGYLEPAAPDERFVAHRRGQWRVFFARPDEAAAGAGAAQLLAAELARRGVAAPVAAALCAEYPADHVRARLDVFDWLTENHDPRVGRNPPGYLVTSIRQAYNPPADYPAAPPPAPPPIVLPAGTAPPPRPPRPGDKSAAAAEQVRASLDREEAGRRERDAPADAYLAALDPAARAALEAEAVAADPDAARTVREAKSDLLRDAARRRAALAHVRRLLLSIGQSPENSPPPG